MAVDMSRRELIDWVEQHPNVFARIAEMYGVSVEHVIALIDMDLLTGDQSITPVGLLQCPPLRPASAAAAKSTWAVAARAAAASNGPRTEAVAQARSAAMMPTGVSSASEPLSAMGGDASIVAGDQR